MARTTAPLLSFDARGQIAKTQVYSSWKGRPYVRRYTIPSNPNTLEQQETRSTFAWMNNVWKYMPGLALDAWNMYANSLRITNRNAWIHVNLSTLRGQADLTGLILSPSAGSGLAAASVVLTPGNDQVQVVGVAPTLPTGWSVTNFIAAAIRQQDPQSGALYVITADDDATDPYDITLTGLASAQTYVVGGWFQYTKPDGTFAYGQSSFGTALTT